MRIDDGLSLESGDILSAIDIAYRTYGTLNKNRDNAIVVIHALTANAQVDEWWNGLFGPGKIFDPGKYFIICPNNLGSPYGSTSPVNWPGQKQGQHLMDFPFYTVRDMAQMHVAFLDTLGIEDIHLLIGPSCGGNIAQEMAITLGQRVKNLALLCCSAIESPWVVAIHEAQRQALYIDADFVAGKGKGMGLQAARAMAMPFYRSHASFSLRQSEDSSSVIKNFKAASYIAYQGKKFNDRFDAYCYFHLINALDTHHLGRNRQSVSEALSQIRAKTICMSFSSDILVPPIEQESLNEWIPDSRYVQIDTVFGHDAFLIESKKVNHHLLQFIG